MTKHAHDDGPQKEAIRVTTGSLKLPERVEGDANARKRMNWVVIVVVAAALAFIAFVTVLISQS
jgi:hypothetical protein